MTARLAYDLDGIQIWHGDNADVRPNPATVDLLLTDPPYGISLDTDYSTRTKHKTFRQWPTVAGDNAPFDPTWLTQYPRAVIWGANNFAHLLPPSSGWLVWDRLDGLWSKRGQGFNNAADAELAWHNLGGTVRTFRHRWQGHNRRTERDAYLHPTQKPVSLMRWIVERFTDPGDLIYDPFMGSGPIARACADLGRRYVGVELEAQYVTAAIGRLAQQTLNFAGGDA